MSANRLGQPDDQVPLRPAEHGAWKSILIRLTGEEDLLETRCMQGGGEDPAAPGVGLEVQREDLELGAVLAGVETRILEDVRDPVAGTRRPVDGDAPAQTPVDEVPNGEADVGLVAGYADGHQPFPKRHGVGGSGNLHPDHRLPLQRGPFGGSLPVRPDLPGPGRVGLADEKIRDHPRIPDEKSFARLEASEQEDHRPAGLDPVSGLEDEASEHQRSPAG